MSHYWDQKSRKASNGMSEAIKAEAEAISLVRKVMTHPDFPDDLRERIETNITKHQISPSEGIFQDKPKKYYEAVKTSRLIENLHDLHHELASRFRFGVFSDNPDSSLAMMEDKQ